MSVRQRLARFVTMSSPSARSTSSVESIGISTPQRAHVAEQRNPAAPPVLLSRAERPSEASPSITQSFPFTDVSKPQNLLLSSTPLTSVKRSGSLGSRNSSTLSLSSTSANPTEQDDVQEGPSSSSNFLDLFVGKGIARKHAVEQVQQNSTQDLNEPAREPQIAASEPSSTGPKPLFNMPALSSPSTWWSSITGTPASDKKVADGETEADEDMGDKFLDQKDRAGKGEPVWARLKDKYETPKLPLVFCHGLFGFDKVGPEAIPLLQVSYWRGVQEALEAAGVEVLITRVPASASVEERARTLGEIISEKLPGREVNLIGHSMGGLDARFLVSQLKPTTFKVRSITTIATPHRGSPFADYILEEWVGRSNLPFMLKLLSSLQVPGGGKAFDDLTTTKMAKFNAESPDLPDIKYYSYGARCEPSVFDSFRPSWRVIYDEEGDNDGLVSIKSAQWGKYIGTLENVNHLDLVGWVGAIRYAYAEWKGNPIQYKPVSFYMSVSEHLAQEGF